MKSKRYKNHMTAKFVFTEDEYDAYMYLLRVLFRLKIIDTNEVLRLSLAFHPFFV